MKRRNLYEKKFICLSLLTIFSSSCVIPALANDFKPNLDNISIKENVLLYEISNISKEVYIDSSEKNDYISANYQIDYYLLVDGVLKLFSQNISQGFTYKYNNKGITNTCFN